MTRTTLTTGGRPTRAAGWSTPSPTCSRTTSTRSFRSSMTPSRTGNTYDPAQIRGLFNRVGAKMNMASVVDGTSNTIMLGESLPFQHDHLAQNYWATHNSGNNMCSTIIPINYVSNYHDPGGNRCVNPDRNYQDWSVSFGFKSRHSGGCNFCFADGSVHFLSQSIDHRTYQLLGCRNDG